MPPSKQRDSPPSRAGAAADSRRSTACRKSARAPRARRRPAAAGSRASWMRSGRGRAPQQGNGCAPVARRAPCSSGVRSIRAASVAIMRLPGWPPVAGSATAPRTSRRCASNWSCVPRSITRPACSTTIWSASATADSRWLTMIARAAGLSRFAHAALGQRRCARMRVSVPVSTADSASSSSSSGFSVSSARAIATLCRCPPDSVMPRSPTIVS